MNHFNLRINSEHPPSLSIPCSAHYPLSTEKKRVKNIFPNGKVRVNWHERSAKKKIKIHFLYHNIIPTLSSSSPFPPQANDSYMLTAPTHSQSVFLSLRAAKAIDKASASLDFLAKHSVEARSSCYIITSTRSINNEKWKFSLTKIARFKSISVLYRNFLVH